MADGQTLPLAEDEGTAIGNDRRALFALPGLMVATGALVCAVVYPRRAARPHADRSRKRRSLSHRPPSTPCSSSACLFLIGREILRLLRARSRGRAAARLHVRIVALFSIVAITPAILVAIFASITLNVGLDRWFSLRTQSIVSSSINVAQAYVLENASYLQGQTVSMANDLERNRQLYSLDRTGFVELMTRQARGAACWARSWSAADGTAILQANIETEQPASGDTDRCFEDHRLRPADADSAGHNQSRRRDHAARQHHRRAISIRSARSIRRSCAPCG